MYTFTTAHDDDVEWNNNKKKKRTNTNTTKKCTSFLQILMLFSLNRVYFRNLDFNFNSHPFTVGCEINFMLYIYSMKWTMWSFCGT